jgi:hypothetical protein
MRAYVRLFALVLLAGPLACEDATVVAIDPILEVTPRHLDFGTVELGQENRLPVQIHNLEIVKGVVESVTIEDDCNGCFLAIDPPTTIEGFEKIEMMMRFRAVRLEVATATATFRTDDPKAPLTTVTMVGRGSDMRKPCIEVAPAMVDFGFVPAGGIAVQSFVVRSCGTNDLLIDSLTIEPAGAPFKITTSTPTPEMPGRLAPGQQASVSLRAQLPETLTGTATAKVVIRSNVLEEVNVPGEIGVVHVPLRAKSNLPPLAIVGGEQTVEPWSRVTLDGTASHDQDDPPDDPISFRWTIISAPDGSTTRLERASTSQPSFWVDLTGRYEIQLVVTDALGLESEPATAIVEALPTNAIRIELTWDHPDSDLDLHLIREPGAFCDCATDCHYRDCGRRPDWFPGTPGSNPSLDIDDRSGFGPENINIDGHGPSRLVQAGSYQIAVHYYSSNDGISSWPTNVSNATVRVYILGLLAGELTRAMTEDNEVWFAGRINWPEKTVTPDGNVQPAQVCGVF